MSHEINRFTDAAILKPELSQNDVIEAIRKCIEIEVLTVCVRPCDIDIAIKMCRNTKTGVCTVLNFPHGSGLPEVKKYEAELYIKRYS